MRPVTSFFNRPSAEHLRPLAEAVRLFVPSRRMVGAAPAASEAAWVDGGSVGCSVEKRCRRVTKTVLGRFWDGFGRFWYFFLEPTWLHHPPAEKKLFTAAEEAPGPKPRHERASPLAPPSSASGS